MRGNPIIGIASTHPFHRSGPIAAHPRPNDTKAELRDQPDGDGKDRRPPPHPWQPAEGLRADGRGDLLWRQQVARPDQPHSWSSHRGDAQNSVIWWDQLLAEIEDLAAELKTKIAKYAFSRATQFRDDTTGPANETAVAWMHQTLEDIAATALGIEIASQELFLRAGTAEDQGSIAGTPPDDGTRAAEQPAASSPGGPAA